MLDLFLVHNKITNKPYFYFLVFIIEKMQMITLIACNLDIFLHLIYTFFLSVIKISHLYPLSNYESYSIF
jgi:hypothetical protein